MSRSESLVEEALARVRDTRRVAEGCAEELQRQQEELRGVDRLLDRNDDLLNRSLQLLRGMTWTGRILNLVEQATSMRRGQTSSPPTRDRETLTSPPVACGLPTSPMDESTRQLSQSVRELRVMGDLLAWKIRANNSLLDSVMMKQDVTLEKTYELTHQTSRVHDKTCPAETNFILRAVGDADFYGILIESILDDIEAYQTPSPGVS